MRRLGCRLSPTGVSADRCSCHRTYVPKAQGAPSAIVQFAAYSKDSTAGSGPTQRDRQPPVFTDRGYAQIVVTRRGMGRSEGQAGVFFNPQDVDDHERCIAWAAEQPWCNGDVVLFGTSYYGMTQPLVAIRRPPALKAFFCNEICTDYFRHIMQFGGVFGLYFVDLWAGANFTETMVRLRVPPIVRALISQVTNSPLEPFWERMVMKRTDAIYRSFMRKTPVKSVREWYVNWMIDGGRRRTASLRDLSRAWKDQIPLWWCRTSAISTCTSSAATTCSKTRERRRTGNG
jgi:putative CocE/NonD family hydrolase